MIAEVAEYLRCRIDPKTVMVGLTPVPADARLLLSQGLVWDATYDDGRLLADVGSDTLLAAGHLDVVRAWLIRSDRTHTPLYRLLAGGLVSDPERASLDFDDRLSLVFAEHGARHPLNTVEWAALLASAEGDRNLRDLARLRRVLAGEPFLRTPSERTTVSADVDPDIYAYIRSGDHAGCCVQLAAWVARLEAAEPDDLEWASVAALHRFLFGDDAAAMSYLQRARFSEVRDEWEEVFGELGRQHIKRVQQVILDVVESAFDGVPFPGPAHTSLYQAEAHDSYADCSQANDHKGRWQDLPRQQILDCQWALPHLGEHSLPYYLPAMIHLAIRERDAEHSDHGSGWIFDSLAYHLGRDFDTRHRQLTPAQRAAIAQFAEYYGVEPEDVSG